MTVVNTNEVYVSIATLIIALVSGILCFSVVMSVYLHPKSKESYHLRIVYNLLMADLLLSVAIVFYYIMQYLLSSRQLVSFCHFYLPMVIYLFLTSFAFTIMFALRFRTMKKPDNVNKIVTWKPPIPFGRLWIFPLVYVLPLFIFAYTIPNVTKVFNNSSDTDQSCTFDHDYASGIALDIIYFEIPCVLTLLINIYSYGKGLIALKNAPHSVLGRQMRRAGGYLSVLLIVWIPNIIYNFLSIFTSNDYASFLNICVILSSSQGILNVCVYVWSDPGMRRFVRKNAFCRKYIVRKSVPGRTSDSQRISGMLRNSNPVRSSANRRDTDDSMEDSYGLHRESEDSGGIGIGNTGIDSLTQITRNSNRQSTKRLSDLTNSQQSSRTINSVQNPMTLSQSMGGSSTRDSVASVDDDATKSSGPKSILIPKSRFSFKQSQLGSSVGDLDHEKFVRFGETSTRFISSATTETRPSERESLSNRNYSDDRESFSDYAKSDLNGDEKSFGKSLAPFAGGRGGSNDSSGATTTSTNKGSTGKGTTNMGEEEQYDDEDDRFYDSDEEDDLDMDFESQVKPRDSSHKITKDMARKAGSGVIRSDLETKLSPNGDSEDPNWKPTDV